MAVKVSSPRVTFSATWHADPNKQRWVVENRDGRLYAVTKIIQAFGIEGGRPVPADPTIYGRLIKRDGELGMQEPVLWGIRRSLDPDRLKVITDEALAAASFRMLDFFESNGYVPAPD